MINWLKFSKEQQNVWFFLQFVDERCKELKQRHDFLEIWVLKSEFLIKENADYFEDYFTPQRYTQIVTGKFARSMYLLFVFPMWINVKRINIARNRYFSKTGKIEGYCATHPCSQKCPIFKRETEIQDVYPIFRALRITNLLNLCISLSQAR